MKKITQFSVAYPITVLMFVLAIVLLGYISFRKLGIDLFPDLNNPRIFVELKAGERSPEEIEEQFVDGIESLAIRQKNVIQVSSISRIGSAQITVEYSWSADMDDAFLELQKTLTSYSQNSTIDELVITQHDPNAAPVMIVGLAHPQITDMDELRKIAENYIRNELIRLEGIAEVEISGIEEKEVVIDTDPYLLEAYQLTPDAVVSVITNYNRNVSGGSITEMGTRYVIKGVGVFNSLTDIENIILTFIESADQTTEEGAAATTRVPVFLKDVATVSFRNKDPENIVRINQRRCLGLAIYKETKFNTVNAVHDLLAGLENIQRALPGYELLVIQNQGEYITTAINEVKQTALIGILLAVMVLYIFLRRIGTTAIISIAIPISVIATFNLMYFNGLTLNIMTLGGLALGAGMLVDNAIVVMENIFRNLEAGLSLKEAAVQGTAQVGGAITAATITTIVVFLPIVYLHGAAGELFKDQAWTVAFSLVSSLVVAMLVIPMLSSKLLKQTSVEFRQPQSIRLQGYSQFLGKVLERRWMVIGAAAALVIITYLLIPVVGSEFVPKTDEGEYAVEVKLPEGTELFRTEQTVANIEQIIRTVLGDEVETIYSRIGPSTGISTDETSVFEDENTAHVKIILKRNHALSSENILNSLDRALADIPDLEAQVIQEQTALQSTLGTDAAPIVVEIKGEDLEYIEELTEQARSLLTSMDELFNIETNFEEGQPEIEVVIDRLRAGMYNIGAQTLSSQLSDLLQGKDAGQWETEGELKDITLHLPEIGINQLEDITFRSGAQVVRLNEIAEIRRTYGPKEIHRRNQARIGKVSANYHETLPFDHVVHKIQRQMDQLDLPPNYSVQITGEEQKRKDAFKNLKFALLLSIVLVYMVLASQFESLVHPFTILLTIPLAGVGGILIFLLLGKTLNIMAYIGLIMLVGIAVNDSIILVDAINKLKKEGNRLYDAVIEAGQRRIRPIIMTSLTTILALLPLTFGFGEAAALRSPMALAVIGGLLTSTLLTLVVIPCVYTALDQFRERVALKK